MSEDKQITKQESSQVKSGGKNISLIISIVALVGASASFLLVNKSGDNESLIQQSEKNVAVIEQLKQQISQQQQQLDNLQQLSKEVTDIDTHSQAQASNLVALQKQIDYINQRIGSPAKSLYFEEAITNIQSAIDYLTLAKDVMLFTSNSTKANSLVNLAFQKLQAVPTIELGAAQQQDIKDALKQYASDKQSVQSVKEILQQFNQLDLTTPTNVDRVAPESTKIGWLNSFVEIRDIPKDQKIVATPSSIQYISDDVYQNLIVLQSALYAGDTKMVQQQKDKLIEIIKTYFVQNDKARTLIVSINKLEPQQTQVVVNKLDNLIESLDKQQSQLILKQQNTAKTFKNGNKGE